jgi:hypothetical protein
VELCQLLQLGRQVRSGSRWHRCWLGRILRRRRDRLHLSLCVGCPLLIGQILLLLRSRILLRVFLLLMMMDRARGPGNDGGGGRDARGTDEWSSSHAKHVILQGL